MMDSEQSNKMEEAEVDDPMEIDDTVQNSVIIENAPEVLEKSIIEEKSKDLESEKTEQSTNNPVVIIDDDDEDCAKSNTDLTGSSEIASKEKPNEIIDLVTKTINSKCINYSCRSGQDMLVAPGACLSYYRVKSTSNSKKKEVCKACYDLAMRDYDSLATQLQLGHILFEMDVPLRNDLVEIDDSDEEDGCQSPDSYITPETVNLIEQNLEKIMIESMAKINFNRQVENGVNYLRARTKNINNSIKEFQQTIKKTRLNLDRIQNNLYNEFRPEIISENELIIDDPAIPRTGSDLRKPLGPRKSPRNVPKPISYAETKNANMQQSSDQRLVETAPIDLPPIGTLIKSPVKIGDLYYIARENSTGSWIRARLLSVLGVYPNIQYKMIELKKQKERIISGREIAYMNPSNVRLEIGMRVIAVLKDVEEMPSRHNSYYAGIVAEPPEAKNRYRYLIFFDIGYYQYVYFNVVNVVLEPSRNVWEDMPEGSRTFIQKYIESRDRRTVKLSKNQTVKAEYNGKWIFCTVKNVDCSLVQLHFNNLNRTEWIYRGSSRLSPIYMQEKGKMHNQIESSTSDASKPLSTNLEGDRPSVRSVARKSTTVSLPVTSRSFLQQSEVSALASKIMYYSPRDQSITKRRYIPHNCSPTCREHIRHNFLKLRGHNPLSKPLLCGWARIANKTETKPFVVYKAPCGKMLRNIAEVHRYLRETRSEMSVDLFDFAPNTRCLAEFSVEHTPDPKDLSNGLEQVPIPVINGINSDRLDFCNYSIKRIPMEGVDLNLDTEFLCGCDCEDDCVDKTKCACWKLTLEGAKYVGRNVDPNSIGYIYKRLLEPVMTGIYECNSRCKCSKMTCLNRVVQHPMSLKLQVFRTLNRGWGIKCLNDVPKGTFICCYAGALLTEQMANEDGKKNGDEYFAELDYVEVCEQHKQDYESDVAEPDDDEDSRKGRSRSNTASPEFNPNDVRNHPTDDNDFVPTWNPKLDNSGIRERLRRRISLKDDDLKSGGDDAIGREMNSPVTVLSSEIDTVTISDDEDDTKEVLDFNPKTTATDSECPSIRSLFGPDEAIYVMDAKNSGNIGRFLNHSCSPNVFVQNVFVDTYDVRFPWVAFFCSQFIRAGTELTWNYNYEIGSVPGEVRFCYCGSVDCKLRLL